MQLLVVAFAVLAITAGAISNQFQNISKSKVNSIFFEQTSVSPTPNTMPNSSPEMSAEPTSTLVPVEIESTLGMSNNDLVYPGATDQGGGVYVTNDSPENVTDWYKEKIRQMNMNVKSFVQTNTNGKVLNKLAGADSKGEINIEITKEPDNSAVTIRTSLQ